MNQKKGIIVTLTGGFLWGLSGTCGQYLMNVHGIPSLFLTYTRLLISGVLLTLYAFVKSREELFHLLKNKKDRKIFLLFAIFGATFNQVAYLRAISYSDAGMATILQYLGPILIVIYMCFYEKRWPKWVEVVCLILAFVGTLILVTGGHIHSLEVSELGLFWGLAAAVALVFYNVIPQSILGKYSVEGILGLAMVLGGALLSFFVPKNVVIPWSFLVFLSFFGVVILGTLRSYSLYLKGVSYIGPVKASLIVCVEPVAAVLFSKLFLNNTITGFSFIGMGLILGAVILLSLQKDG